MKAMPMLDVEGLQALYEAAAQGEWKCSANQYFNGGAYAAGPLHNFGDARENSCNAINDSKFITVMHNEWSAIRAELIALQAENLRLKSENESMTRPICGSCHKPQYEIE